LRTNTNCDDEEGLWPAFAAHLGMEPGPVRTVRLADVMPGKAPLWDRKTRP
jgi:hypothetical protein